MTILESTEILLQWFQANDSFSLKQNYKELFLNYISETPGADEASIIAALDGLVEKGLLKKATSEKDGLSYYILTRPFESMEQNITVGYQTVFLLTEINKQISDKIQDKSVLIDPLNITEKDILITLRVLIEQCKLQISGQQENQPN